jgi:succinoglycan biosynthesis protein ExoM
MNNVLICICTYKRNKKLIECLDSIKKLRLFKKFNIEILVLDNTTSFLSKKIIQKYKKNNNIRIYQKNEKRRGVVFARNACLKFIKLKTPKYIAFIDDDCTFDKYWMINVFKLINKFKADVVTGPQLYKTSNSTDSKTNFTKFFEKNYNKKVLQVNWAATNNVFFKFELIRKTNLRFDEKLNKFGMGEDQLFFSQLSKKGKKIYWSEKVKVTETTHNHRLNLKWLINRSYRLGILGNHVDKKIYGNLFGLFINFLKSGYYFIKFVFCLLFPLQKNYKINLNNYLFRSIGKLLGPFLFNKTNFLK